jgi:pentatricopeptide repeat protein
MGCSRVQPRSEVALFVASNPLSSPNNVTPRATTFSSPEEQENRNKWQRGKPGKSYHNKKRVSHQTAASPAVRAIKRQPPTKRQSSQAAYQFNRVLQSILPTTKNQPTLEAAQKAQRLLLSRVYAQQDSGHSVPKDDASIAFDTISFNIVMQAWARLKSMDAARSADKLLRLLWTETNLQADSYSYAAAINSYAKAGGQRPAALRATELLQEFLGISHNPADASFNKRSSKEVPLTDVCHNAVMDAWAVSGDERSGQRAEQILRQLRQDPLRKPTRVSYNACIKAYARSGQPQEAQRILNEMKILAKEGDSEMAPDKVSLSTCVSLSQTTSYSLPSFLPLIDIIRYADSCVDQIDQGSFPCGRASGCVAMRNGRDLPTNEE